MFLKSIEIRGFKSFADKTDLILKKGITAVVGPNGSGKSNISDAVRWVLGEQSVKSLRGGKMEDVIFAGTQFRKPVGLAQVSLTLDNADGELPVDYSEVTISRRLYRSGESEYYINNTHCRLKDVQELFMDTGIGKEGYSIIGQGKIDAILNGKPEDRRGLLEEAAGIVKFKSRKEEAEKRLNNTEQNLIRICDILKTYEDRLEPLRIESEKAKAFLELSEDLKSKEVNIIVHSIDNLQGKVENVKSLVDNIKGDILKFTEEKESYKEELSKLNAQLELCEASYKQNQQSYYKSKSELQDLNSDTNILNERISNLQAFIDKNLIEIALIEEKLNGLINLKNNQEQILSDIQKEQGELNTDILKREEEIRSINFSLGEDEEKLNNLKEKNIKLQDRIADLKNNVIILNSELSQFNNKLEELKLNSENYMNSIKINSTTKVMLEDNIIKSKTKIEALEEEVRKKKLEITRLNSLVQKDDKTLKELSTALNKQEANYQMLNNLDKAYEGYNRASKILMQDIQVKKLTYANNKCFILGEVINVSKDLETAVEIALGGAISDIITTDEEVAKSLINYLKVNNIGRATFLPLNIVSGKKLTNIERLKSIKGYLGVASELISYDRRFANAIEHILGRTVISENMDCALNIAKATSYSVKIVTLGGEVINPGGALTGGSIYHKSTSIIGRKREIEELEVKIQENKLLVEGLSVQLNDNRNLIKEIDNSCLNLKDNIYFENIEITKLNEKISSIVLDNNKLTEALNNSRNELKAINEKNSAIKGKIEIKTKELEEANRAEEQNSYEIEALETNLRSKNSSILDKKESYTGLKIKKAQIDEIVINKIGELNRLSKEADELSAKKLSIMEEVNESNHNIETSKALIDSNNNKFESLNSEIKKYEALFQENEIEQIKLKDKIKSINESFEKLALVSNKKDEEYHRQELSLTRLEGEMETLYSKLNEELSLTYAEALKYKAPIDNFDKHKRYIADIKSKIAALGIVNVGAVEEYKEVKEKYTFMNSQKEDLENAKAELASMISEITIKMKDVFNDNLTKLRVVFNETFRELFKGGRADLILGEGDELSANIEINVEPPGKKLQNINLMSGGEKVLSAIALLFAILKMKPTPFCILDEIEAALDDANVLRYAEFLNKFSGNIQFIVITHRKGTMEVGDVLYGVTMEEKGVSKIVSVDLSKQAILT